MSDNGKDVVNKRLAIVHTVWSGFDLVQRIGCPKSALTDQKKKKIVCRADLGSVHLTALYSTHFTTV